MFMFGGPTKNIEYFPDKHLKHSRSAWVNQTKRENMRILGLYGSVLCTEQNVTMFRTY
jgi:hypothetical protein